MQYGLSIEKHKVKALEEFCDLNNIEYQIWEAEALFLNDDRLARNPGHIDINFETKQDRELAHYFLRDNYVRPRSG